MSERPSVPQDEETLRAALRRRIWNSRASLDLIDEGDWTRRDAVHLMLADAAEGLLQALAASDPPGTPEGREGMVTVYDHENRYLGCMGRETWDNLLAVPVSGSRTQREALELILAAYHAREPEDMPMLPFRMKEIALRALAAAGVGGGEPARETD